jgi:hypothetical protein
VALVIVGGVTLRAQEQSAQASASAQGAATAEPTRNRTQAAAVPLKVTIVLSKYQNDKRVSSLPYELTVVTNNGPSRIRMGTQVPVAGMGASVPATPAPSPAAGAPSPQKIGPFSYREVGTNIDCLARELDSGRFGVTVTIEDSSLYEDSQRTGEGAKVQKVEGVSSLRTFRTTNQLVLRDGQSSEFTAATDKVTGEVIKAAVTLTVVR